MAKVTDSLIPKPKRDESPELHFWRIFLTRSRETLEEAATSEDIDILKEAIEIRKWIFRRGTRRHPSSFELGCKYLNLDPAYIRAKIWEDEKRFPPLLVLARKLKRQLRDK